jgi:hypothetical protein
MTDDVHADGRQDSGKRASFAQSEDDRRPNPKPLNLQEIADRAERLRQIATAKADDNHRVGRRGREWAKENEREWQAADDLTLLLSELQKAREALECISSLAALPHRKWAERWPEWERVRLAQAEAVEFRPVIALNNLYGAIARQAPPPLLLGLLLPLEVEMSSAAPSRAKKVRVLRHPVYARDARGLIIYESGRPKMQWGYFPQRRLLGFLWWASYPGAGIGYRAYADEADAWAFLNSRALGAGRLGTPNPTPEDAL